MSYITNISLSHVMLLLITQMRVWNDPLWYIITFIAIFIFNSKHILNHAPTYYRKVKTKTTHITTDNKLCHMRSHAIQLMTQHVMMSCQIALHLIVVILIIICIPYTTKWIIIEVMTLTLIEVLIQHNKCKQYVPCCHPLKMNIFKIKPTKSMRQWLMSTIMCIINHTT